MRVEAALRQQAAGQHAAQQQGDGIGKQVVQDAGDREARGDGDGEQQSERVDAAPATLFEPERRRIPRLVAPCYEPADPGHRMAGETIDGVRISDDRFGRDGNEGKVGEHGRCAYHGARGIGTGRAWRRSRRHPAALSRSDPAVDRSVDRHQSRCLSGGAACRRRPGRACRRARPDRRCWRRRRGATASPTPRRSWPRPAPRR